jgi:hypothetical protein
MNLVDMNENKRNVTGESAKRNIESDMNPATTVAPMTRIEGNEESAARSIEADGPTVRPKMMKSEENESESIGIAMIVSVVIVMKKRNGRVATRRVHAKMTGKTLSAKGRSLEVKLVLMPRKKQRCDNVL